MISTRQFLRWDFSKNLYAKRASIIAMATYSTDPVNPAIQEKFRLPSRFDKISKYSPWSDFIHLAIKHKPLNLGQGFPDFPAPAYITEALKNVALSKDVELHQFSRSSGHPRLVKALANLYSKELNRSLNPETEVFVAPGALAALYVLLAGNLEEGDEVIVIEPFFEVYQGMIKMSGGIIQFIPLRLKKDVDSNSLTVSSGDYELDKKELESKFNSKTKAIIFNNPNNPLGKVFSLEEMTFIADLCKKWNVMCISDEVYEWLVFPPDKHIRMANLPGMWDRTVTVGSAGKIFSVTGWKVGWAIGPSNLLKNMETVCDLVAESSNTPVQEAVAIAFETETARMDKEDCYFYSLGRDLLTKRDYLVKTFSDVGMRSVVPQGGYFILADFVNWESRVDLSGETDQWKDSRFCKWMTKNIGLMGMPSTVFYGDNKMLSENVVRYCFVKDQEYLKKIDKVLRDFYKKNF